MPVIPCGDGSEMVCRTRLGDQGRIGPSRWNSLLGALVSLCLIPSPPPAQPRPAQPKTALSLPSRKPMQHSGRRSKVTRRRVEFALT